MAETSRNVRPRTGEPEAERGESLPQSRRDSSFGSSQPEPWPRASHLDDLPVQLRAHFERQAERNGTSGEDDRVAFVAFMADRFEVCNRKDEVPKEFGTTENGSVKKVLKGTNYDRKQNDKVTKGELTQLRSAIGNLAWIARQARPDLAYKVSYLQTCVKSATVTTLKECNKTGGFSQNHYERSEGAIRTGYLGLARLWSSHSDECVLL